MAFMSTVLAIALGAVVIAGSLGLGTAAAIGRAPSSAATPLVTDAAPVPPGITPMPVPAGTEVSITLTLTGPRSASLDAFLRTVEDPTSVAYHQFLTANQFETEFGPTAGTVSAAAAALTAYGARDVSVGPGRLSVAGVLPASSVESLFGVSLVGIGLDRGAPVYTATGNPVLPARLAGLVQGIGGLSNVVNAHLSYHLQPSRETAVGQGSRVPAFIEGNTSGAQWFLGSDFTEAFGASKLFPGTSVNQNATFPTHVAIATLLASGWNQTTGTNLPPWDPTVIRWYLNHTLAPTWPISNATGVPVTIDGITPPLPGPSGGTNDSSLDQTENSLDLEMAGSLAPGAPLYNFYFAGSLLNGSLPLSDIADAFATELTDSLTYNYSPARLGVVSGSFGLPDLNDSLWNSALQMAAATGVTVVIASGDQGNAPDSLSGRSAGPWPTWPGSAAFNTSGSVAVGGVSLTLSGPTAGSYNASSFRVEFDANSTGIASLSTWYTTTGGPGHIEGSEGGVSQVIPEPYWQFHSAAQSAIANATGLEGATSLGRAEPDIAFPANDTIVTDFANSTGTIFASVVEGTSVAAPVLAGLLADLIAVRSGNAIATTWHPFGYLDPVLYRMASFYAAHPLTTTDPFLDVTTGSNYVFSAAPGWDPTTGWGSVQAVPFLAAAANRTVTGYVYTGPTPGIPPAAVAPGVPWTEIYVIFGAGIVAAVALVVVMARPSRPASGSVPFGARIGNAPSFPEGAQGGIYPGATFLCPYCGGVRPAEPIQCPECGAL